jgi:hypothetical protein
VPEGREFPQQYFCDEPGWLPRRLSLFAARAIFPLHCRDGFAQPAIRR